MFEEDILQEFGDGTRWHEAKDFKDRSRVWLRFSYAEEVWDPFGGLDALSHLLWLVEEHLIGPRLVDARKAYRRVGLSHEIVDIAFHMH
jgi:hypothetical protein